MANERTNILFPIGRMVYGSLYDARTKDGEGNPLVIKTGANAGQPTQRYDFGVAIHKGAEQHWNQTQWGKPIYDAGVAGFPQGQHGAPTFSWKITDGDSRVPNKKGTLPCSREGYPGHWVVSFSSTMAPRLVNANGTAPLLEPGVIKPGHYVQVYGSVASNGSTQNPGVYVNPEIVAHSAFGEEIRQGVDAASVGFGGALPAGASAVPVGGMAPPAAAAPAPAPAPQAAPPAALAVPVTPNHQFANGPAAVAPPPAPPAAPVRQMLPAANGLPYESYIASGWTDAQLIANDMMSA